MDIQRLRNLTTGRLHTEMKHIYEDLEAILGKKGLMTHMLPKALEAVKPWLRKSVTEQQFWNSAHDPDHQGEFELASPSKADRAVMRELFKNGFKFTTN